MSRSRTNGQAATRSTLEGALMAGLVCIFVAVTYYVPISGLIFSVVWPIPIALLYRRYDLRTALLAVIVATLILMALVGPLNALDTALLFGPLGLALGYAFRRGWPTGRTLALGTLAVAFATLGSVAVFFFIGGQTPAQWLLQDNQALVDSLRQAASALPGAENLADLTQSLLTAMPWLILTIGGGIALLVDYAVAVAVFRRLGYQICAPGDFSRWRLPDWLRFGAALILAGARFATAVPLPFRQLVAVAAQLILAVQGLAIAEYALRHLGANPFIRYGFYLVTLIQPPTWWLLAIVAVIDGVVDLRSKLPTAQPAGAGEKEVAHESHPHPRSEEPRQKGKRRRGR